MSEELDALILRILTDPAVVPDPYPLYHRLRSEAPVYEVGFGNAVVLSRYDDARAVLRNSTDFGNREDDDAGPNRLVPGAASVQRDRESRSMLFMNPPDHTRLRGLVSRGFTPRRVEALRPHVVELTDELLDAVADEGEVNLVEALAFPLPANVISELVGVPRADRDWLRPLVADLTATLEPNPSEEDVARATASGTKVREYILDLMAERRREPRDDLLSTLISASDDGDRLSEAEVVTMTLLIYAAGFETTTNLIGNMVHTLLDHPDELARVRADRSLVPNTVEEVLRFQPPVQIDGRYTFHDTEVGGHLIRAGQSVLTFLGAANRDPAVVDDPDRFDVTRPEIPLLSFGSGIHYCLGASLARLEGQVVLERLLTRFGRWERASETVWKPRLTLRGPGVLPVCFAA